MGKPNSPLAKKFADRLKEEFGIEVKSPVMGGLYEGYVSQADWESCSRPYFFQSDVTVRENGYSFFSSEPFRKLLKVPYLVINRDYDFSSEWDVYGFKDRTEADEFFKPFPKSRLKHPYDFKHKAQ